MKILAGMAVAVVGFVTMLAIAFGVFGSIGMLTDTPEGTRALAASPTSPSPQANYDPVRLQAGLIAAALSLGSAAVLVRRTDWSPVGEAAAPQIDDAEYADLDAIVAALAQE